MDSNWKTFSHEVNKDILLRQINNQTLAHAYLFFGPPGVGKKTLALETIKKIFQNQFLENHPDYVFLDCEQEGKIDNLKSLARNLALKPVIAEKKAVVIDNAEKMTLEAANALLKTLEEPGRHALIFLIASSGVLPTVASRCQVLFFSAFSKLQMESFIQTEELQTHEKAITISAGSPGMYKRLMADKGFLKATRESYEEFISIFKMEMAERLITALKFSDRENADLENLFRSSAHALQDMDLKEDSQISKFILALNRAATALKTNKNRKLILQGLALSV